MENLEKAYLSDEELVQVTGGDAISAFAYEYETETACRTEFLKEVPVTPINPKSWGWLADGIAVRVLSRTPIMTYTGIEYLHCKVNLRPVAEGYIKKIDLKPEMV